MLSLERHDQLACRGYCGEAHSLLWEHIYINMVWRVLGPHEAGRGHF